MHKRIPSHRPPVCDLSVIKAAVSRAVHSMTSHPNCRLPNMASSRVPEREVREEARRAATANLDFSPHKHSLLIIVGRTAHLRQTGHICGDIERGTFASRTRLSHLPQHRSPPLPTFAWETKTNCKLSSRKLSLRDAFICPLLQCLCHLFYPPYWPRRMRHLAVLHHQHHLLWAQYD